LAFDPEADGVKRCHVLNLPAASLTYNAVGGKFAGGSLLEKGRQAGSFSPPAGDAAAVLAGLAPFITASR
jgi:hypothetical protein